MQEAGNELVSHLESEVPADSRLAEESGWVQRAREAQATHTRCKIDGRVGCQEKPSERTRLAGWPLLRRKTEGKV